MSTKEQIISANNSFERHVKIDEPCVFAFAFEVADGGSLEFSVLLRSAKGKDTRLLPASSYNQHQGEVLLPGPGTAIARWHNPSGWLWSSSATVRYSLVCRQQEKRSTKKAAKAPAPAPAPPPAAKPATPSDAAGTTTQRPCAASTTPVAPPVSLHTRPSRERIEALGPTLGRSLASRPGAQELARRGILKRMPSDVLFAEGPAAGRAPPGRVGGGVAPSLHSAMHSLERRLLEDTLQGRLRARSSKDVLAERGILKEDPSTAQGLSPAIAGKRQSLQRAMLSDSLRRQLERRSTETELVERRILPERGSPLVTDAQRSLARRGTEQALAGMLDRRRSLGHLPPAQQLSHVLAAGGGSPAGAAAVATGSSGVGSGSTALTEEVLQPRTDVDVAAGGSLALRLSIPSAGTLYVLVAPKGQKPVDVALRFVPDLAHPSKTSAARDGERLSTAKGAAAVAWREQKRKNDSVFTAERAGVASEAVMALTIGEPGRLSMTLTHVPTAWVWESATTLTWAATFCRPLPEPLPTPPPLVAPPFAPPGSRPLKSSPLVPSEDGASGHSATAAAPAATNPSTYDDLMSKAMEEALARALRERSAPGNGRTVAATAPSAPATVPPPPPPPPTEPLSSDNDSVAGPSTKPSTSAPAAPPAPPKRKPTPPSLDLPCTGSKELAVEPAPPPKASESPRPSAGAAASAADGAAAVEETEDAFGSLVEESAAVRLQSLHRGKMAREDSAERKEMLAAMSAAAEAALSEISSGNTQLRFGRQRGIASATAPAPSTPSAPRGASPPAATPAPPPATPSMTPSTIIAATPAALPTGPLPLSALALLDELNLGKYRKRFIKEDLTECAMFVAMLEMGERGANDLRQILREVGMSVGHRERMLLALTSRPPPTGPGGK